MPKHVAGRVGYAVSFTSDGGVIDGYSNYYLLRLNVARVSTVGTTATPPSGLRPGNGFVYYTFTGPGSLIVSGSNVTGEMLVVGGGGGGGNYPSGNSGGGGGAGGLVYYPTFNFTTAGYTISIGGGGARATTDAAGGNGTPTTFSDPVGAQVTALGGGGGAGANVSSPNPGALGSGGGGSGYLGVGRPGNQPTQPQAWPGYLQYGNAGGANGGAPNPGASGGGGGAGGGGGGSGAGTGGAGLAYPQFEGSLIGLPSLAPLNGSFAGGGAGNKYSPDTYYDTDPVPGGGGGMYPGVTPVSNGFTNSGGGGAGGAAPAPSPGQSGDGGSGIVVIRFAASLVGS